jgi:hypothetical protein
MSPNPPVPIYQMLGEGVLESINADEGESSEALLSGMSKEQIPHGPLSLF